MLRLLTWLLSLAVHAGLLAFFLLTPGGAALQKGTGHDLMVVQQGTAIQGLKALGADEATVQPVEAQPQQLASKQPQPQEVKPVKDTKVIESPQGPEQTLDTKPVEKKPLPPQQVASVVQEATVKQLQSSGAAESGGSATMMSAYIGSLRTHLEKTKVNPRSGYTGTVVVSFTVDSSGNLISRKIQKSSGSKVLDNAALASIDKAAPFPPIPLNLHKTEFTLSVPYRFIVHNRR